MVEQRIRTSSPSMGWFPRKADSRLNSVPPSWLKIGDSKKAHPIGATESQSVLFVCTGNICRSAFAAAYLAHLIRGSGIRVESAGIGALVGHGMDERALLMARQLGINASAHRARQLTGRILGGASLVIVFGSEHYDWIQENNPGAIAKTLAIGQLASDIEQEAAGAVRDRSVSDLLAAIKQTKPVPDESSWIRDPYKKDDSEYIQIIREVIDAVDRLRGKIEW